MAGERARALRVARIRHRVGQFAETVLAPLNPIDPVEAAAFLVGTPDTEALHELFGRMSRAEQHHGLVVCRRLRARGFTSPDLLAAALLHDVGKTRCPPRLWERVAVVLLEHYAPHLARWISVVPAAYPFNAPPWRRLRRAVRLRRYHACWGARMVGSAGASPRTTTLIRHHHAAHTYHDPELAALQVADET